MKSKDGIRTELAAQMDAFLAGGGSVTRCPTKLPLGNDGKEFAQSRLAMKQMRARG